MKRETKPMLKFALPVGSLNNVERGNTSQLLADAGYELDGYAPGKESMKPTFVNDPEVEAFVDRPQNMPVSLARGTYDLAILGNDWAEEWKLVGIKIEEVANLDYGKVRIVVAVKSESEVSSIEQLVESSRSALVKVSTEYLLLAAKAMTDTNAWSAIYDATRPQLITRALQLSADALKTCAGVAVMESFGMTEIGAINGSGIDAIVESTQTGRSIREAGLKSIGTILSSTARLYASPLAMAEPAKLEKIEQAAKLLMGVVNGRSCEYVTFNIPERQLQQVVNYLMERGYALKMPTVSMFAGNAVVSTVLPKSSYPSAVVELLKAGADDLVNIRTGQIVTRQKYAGARA